MKIIFFGTPSFAANILEYLIDNKIEIVAIVTQSDKPRAISPVKILSQKRLSHVDIYQPEKASDKDFIEKLKKYDADLFVVVAYGKILKQELLDIPKKESINVHASLLPKYRGAAPIQRAIIDGEQKTGITIMKMVKELDAGDIIAKKEVAIDEKMNFKKLQEKLCEAAKPLLLEVIKAFKKGKVTMKPQDSSKVFYASKITLEDLKIDFNQPAEKAYNLIRAFSPSPGARCILQINDQKKMLKILESEIVNLKGKAKEILKFEKDEFIIACKEKALKIIKLQLEGKKVMEAADFIRGIKNKIKIVSFY